MVRIDKHIQENLHTYGLNLIDLKTAGTHNTHLSKIGAIVVNAVDTLGDDCHGVITKLANKLIKDNSTYYGDTALRVIGEVLKRVLRGKEEVERKDMDYYKMVSASLTQNLETYDERQKVSLVLKTIRKNRKLSRINMSKYLGIKISRYYRYEIGATYMREEDAERVANRIGYTIDALHTLIMENADVFNK